MLILLLFATAFSGIATSTTGMAIAASNPLPHLEGSRPGQTTVSGSVSGSAVFSQPFAGSHYKKVVILLKSLDGTANYTFPTAFTETPDYFIGASSGPATVISISTKAVTISGAPSSGVIVLEGY